MKSFLKNDIGLVSIPNWEPKCWINIEDPSPEDKKYLLQDIQIPEAFYNDIEDVDERPRIEHENGWTLIILRLPYKSNNTKLPYSTIPLGLIFKEDFIVSISFHQSEILTDFIAYTKRKKLHIQDNIDLTFRLLLSSSVWFLKYLKQINNNIKLAENQLERSIRNEDLQTLLQIEKCLVYFTTSLKGNDILVHRLKNLKSQQAYDLELVEDVEIELRQALETTNIYSDILSGMMDAYASVISNNLNVIMKQLTSISIILMIPTLIASLYGMNVHNSLEDNPFGFWLILFFSIALTAIGIFIFRKRRWF